jgi:intracellular sulfur oxidation DsrE/DsrF family protein
MQRRAAFKSLIVAGLAGLGAIKAQAETARATRVVYHIADPDKVAFALGNMRNHHAGGPQGLQLAAVVHGPALGVFRANTDNEALKRAFAAHREAGDAFYACAYTLAGHGWTLDDLLPDFALADKGGVVKLADLQAQGWIYLRP